MDKVKNIIGEYILEESLNEFDISFDEMYLGLDEMKKEISNMQRDLYLGFIDLKDERINMQNILDFLIDRGYIEQVTHYEELKKEFENGEVTFYVGIDPTADSLHIGHFMVLMIVKDFKWQDIGQSYC